MPDIDLTELRRIAEKATPGPWKWIADDASMFSLSGPDELYNFVLSTHVCPACQKTGGRCLSASDANAVYIATANPKTVLALLDRLERVETALRKISHLTCNAPSYTKTTYPSLCPGGFDGVNHWSDFVEINGIARECLESNNG